MTDRNAACIRSIASRFCLVAFSLAILGAITQGATPQPPDDPLAWPAAINTCQPWAYNWWHGSAVDKENLAREMQRYHDGGLGGIHIIPIYGLRNDKSRDIDFLSPKWMEMLTFAIDEGKRLGMGVDMTTGTGWCFGGPNLSREEGCWDLKTQMLDVAPGAKISQRFDPTKVWAMRAVSSTGQQLDLKSHLDAKGNLAWAPENSAWKIYVVTTRANGWAVKRPAPGGVGPMLDPFSPTVMNHYLKRFTDAFSSPGAALPRSMYHDSYEYVANFSPALPEAFAARRGYRLEDHITTLCADPKNDEQAARLYCDYNETISDQMIDSVFPIWIKWCHDHGMLTRYQAHGSPANLLDLYALADIPETEMFGRGTRDPHKSGFDDRFGEGARSPLVSKFASSAAHVAGHQLTASETGTWMAEHFCETLEEMKCLQDQLMVSGINHIFYHGCCYSPDDAAWPGWVFYASTEMNPRNSIWHDAPALNAYITRCQSVLQSGRPANDVLLYWPIHDFWQGSAKLAPQMTVEKREWIEGQPLGKTAQTLWDRGYGFDYMSDRQVALASVNADGLLAVPGGNYRVILVPPAKVMPLPTLEKLLDLAKQGATVLFQDCTPDDVPGLGDLANRRALMKAMLEKLKFESAGADSKRAAIGKGQILVGDAEVILANAGVLRESIVDQPGVMFIRRAHANGFWYFIVNHGVQALDREVTLATPAASAVVMDPMTGAAGVCPVIASSPGQSSIHLRIEPGGSIIVRTFLTTKLQAPLFVYANPGATAATIGRPWNVKFIEGGPELPKPFQATTLGSWTRNGDQVTESFAGAAVYSTTFDSPGPGSWVLDLGEVCHSARVRVNGKDCGTLLMHPYRLLLAGLKTTGNTLEVEVTNLSANRIRDLDRRKVKWKIFADINIVTIDYKRFDASNWPIMDSGLLGPVTLKKQMPEKN